MRNTLPTYQRPLQSKEDPKVDVTFWDKAYDAYDAKDYKTALIHVLNYINPSLLKNVNINAEILAVTRNQGSAEVQIKITDTDFYVNAPFLKVTENTNRVALMRKVAEVNFNPLTLAQIHLQNNILWFKFACPIDLCQPNKIYDVLREICVYSDDYDDEFIRDYFASFINQPNHQALGSAESDAVWQQLQTIFREYNDYNAYFDEQRWDAFKWDIMVISILRIANMPCVHGTLRTTMNEYVYNLYNGSIDYNLRMNKGKTMMQELCAKGREEIMKDVYHADTLMSLRWRSSDKIIQEQVKHWENYVNQYKQSNDNLNLAYYLMGCLQKLMYDFNLEELHKNAIESTLEKISAKNVDEGAQELLKLYNQLAYGNMAEQKEMPQSKKGFFANLFN